MHSADCLCCHNCDRQTDIVVTVCIYTYCSCLFMPVLACSGLWLFMPVVLYYVLLYTGMLLAVLAVPWLSMTVKNSYSDS